MTLAPERIAEAAQLACLLEVSAPKPGNVSPGRHFRDTSFEDFLASAVAIGAPFRRVGERPLGETIRAAVEATAQVARANTNLGIILLLAPLARATLEVGGPLRERVAGVLRATTVYDAEQVYAAIRRAAPGGMGRTDSQDLAAAPSVTLAETMRLAAGRDSVAKEYTTGFEITFTLGAPALRAGRAAGLGWSDAIVETFLTVLAATPDTLIARKCGSVSASEVSREAERLLRLGGVRSAEGRRSLETFDAGLRDAQNSRNPGTTADLTAAAIFVELAESGWQSSRGHPRAQ